MQDTMNAMDIAFPHLNIYLSNVPKSFSIFGFEIAFYGVLVGTGILLGTWIALHMAKKTGQDPDIYWDFAVYAVMISVIGARIYYVIFAWDVFKNDLLSIFNTRNGGLAIYGGVIGAFSTAAVFCHVKKISFPLLCDTGVVGLALGQVIGRWGNFVNREAFGQYTDGLFAMRLPIDMVRPWEISDSIAAHIAEGTNYIQVHPTFLYESMWNFCLLGVMYFYTKHKKFNGEIALLYLGGYGLGRCMIESLRTDQLLLFHTGLPVSQLLAGVLVIFSAGTELLARSRIKNRRMKSSEKE